MYKGLRRNGTEKLCEGHLRVNRWLSTNRARVAIKNDAEARAPVPLFSRASRLAQGPVCVLAHPEGPGHRFPRRRHVRRHADPVLDGGAVRLDGLVVDRDERARVKPAAEVEKPAERVRWPRQSAMR